MCPHHASFSLRADMHLWLPTSNAITAFRRHTSFTWLCASSTSHGCHMLHRQQSVPGKTVTHLSLVQATVYETKTCGWAWWFCRLEAASLNFSLTSQCFKKYASLSCFSSNCSILPASLFFCDISKLCAHSGCMSLSSSKWTSCDTVVELLTRRRLLN